MDIEIMLAADERHYSIYAREGDKLTHIGTSIDKREHKDFKGVVSFTTTFHWKDLNLKVIEPPVTPKVGGVSEVSRSLLYEYGEAIRGDWSDVDGRSVRGDLQDIADAIDNPEADIAVLRASVNLCPAGGGHWLDTCDEMCNDSGME